MLTTVRMSDFPDPIMPRKRSKGIFNESLVSKIVLENNTLTFVPKACTDELIGLLGIWILLELGSPHEGVDEGTGPKIRTVKTKGITPPPRESPVTSLCVEAAWHAGDSPKGRNSNRKQELKGKQNHSFKVNKTNMFDAPAKGWKESIELLITSSMIHTSWIKRTPKKLALQGSEPRTILLVFDQGGIVINIYIHIYIYTYIFCFEI